MTASIARPSADEYAPYYHTYVSRVPDGDILAILAEQPAAVNRLLRDLSDAEANSRFAPGEWTIKEVVGHLSDAERVFAHRAFCFSRNDRAEQPSMEQDAFVANADFGARTLDDLLDEFELLRRANVIAFSHLPARAAERRGIASGNQVTVRALIAILAGHVNYHLEDLREEYLPAIGR